MQHPEQFDTMINYAFVSIADVECGECSLTNFLSGKAITTVVYGTMGVCGYLMFGRSVTDEVWLVGQPMRAHVYLTMKRLVHMG
jgi:hypothetical protein